MPEKNYECKLLEWDTDYFGVKSARVNLFGNVDERGQEDILSFCENYDFVTLANFENRNENNLWIGNKTAAFLTDVNIQFVKELNSNEKCSNDYTYVTNNLPVNDQILSIARKSFRYSRFFNDPNLSESKSQNIYLHWTEGAFRQQRKYFVICEREGNIAGYLLFSSEENYATVELIAVDEVYQGQGVGKALIKAMESFVYDKDINKIKVGTQVNNIPAVQFYSKMGFTYVNCGSIYHIWND